MFIYLYLQFRKLLVINLLINWVTNVLQSYHLDMFLILIMKYII